MDFFDRVARMPDQLEATMRQLQAAPEAVLPTPDLAQAKEATRSHLSDHLAQARAAHQALMARLHRFLVEHEVLEDQETCATCHAIVRDFFSLPRPHRRPAEPHAPDCEWVALVALTKP